MADFISEFMDEFPPSKDLSRVKKLAERAVALEQTVEQLEEELTAAKAELLVLRRESIPDAMAEHGLSEFKLEDGSGVKITNFAAGVLPKEPVARLQALAILEEHGGEGLISNELIVNFQRKEHNRAVALKEELRAAGYDAIIESTVHHMQLAAWCKEKVRHGEKLDFEKLGVYVGPDTKVILPNRE